MQQHSFKLQLIVIAKQHGHMKPSKPIRRTYLSLWLKDTCDAKMMVVMVMVIMMMSIVMISMLSVMISMLSVMISMLSVIS